MSIKIKNNLNSFFHNSDVLFVLIILIIIIALFFTPTGFKKQYPNSIRVEAEILDVDNENILQFGIVKTGEQKLDVLVKKGKYKGKIFKAANHLIGKMEFDKIFQKGDNALVTIDLNKENTKVIDVNAIDHYRINIELFLLALFIIFLIIFAGFTGAKAVLSFLFTGMVVLKVLFPLILKGYNPILLSLITISILTFVIIFLIAGFTKKGIVAFLGAITGVFATCLLSVFFGDSFYINGAVEPFSETLLYSGFPHLDLTEIFLAGIFISSSGAVMDIAMDISASQNEIMKKHPTLSQKEIIKSGFAVGKAVVGTMTTTLLLAYSGGFTAMLLVFIGQGTPTINVFNINYVAAEILHTLVGSFGLILVAPFTAIIGGLFYTKNKSVQN
ncbi:MAG: YibE/F family protein [Bacteroidales bacterium]|nr:YibE/F family protein [Bacteroidales bacterium]